MKRSARLILRDAFKLIWIDIKNMKIAILLIIAYLGLNRMILPTSCIWVAITGFPCPGCGLTRAGMALLRGNFSEAWHTHAFIYAIIVLLIAMFIYRYFLRRSLKIFTKYGILLVAGMLVFYIYRMVCLFPGNPPMSYYRHNLISTFFR